MANDDNNDDNDITNMISWSFNILTKIKLTVSNAVEQMF